MPLTEKGYQTKTSEAFKRDIELVFQKYFGEDLDLSENEVGGMLVGVFKDWLTQNELLAEAIYNSGFVLKASGANLDDLAAEENIFRKPAMPAYCDLQIQGYYREHHDVFIPANSQFSTPDGNKFVTTRDCVINQPTGNIKDEQGNQLGQTTVQVVSLSAGSENNVIPNSIINPAQVIDGLYSVTNPDAATGGSDTETDSALRTRIINNRKSAPNETKDGIETAIKNIAGVSDARLVANNTMQVDSFGNPAKSSHLYVIGGDDVEIATIYFNHLTPVARTVGTKTVRVLDVAKKTIEINFDRAKTVPIYIQINLDVDDTVFNSDASVDEIKTNILAYFNQMKMGSTVLYSKLFAPAYSVNGIDNVSIKLGRSIDSLSNNDIKVSQFELPTTGRDLITINTKGGG